MATRRRLTPDFKVQMMLELMSGAKRSAEAGRYEEHLPRSSNDAGSSNYEVPKS